MATYADMTWDDPNALKRWVQRRRLSDALARVPETRLVRTVIDFGGGDGALSALACERWPDAQIVCFEPAAHLAAEAQARLMGKANVRVVRDEASLPSDADVIFCTEVFEHLPDAQSEAALAHIERLLRPGGLLVIGVPVEVGLPAGLKGLFRAARRKGDYDTAPGRIWSAVLGRPPEDRPLSWIAAGRPYHAHHLGFDHRRLTRRVTERIGKPRVSGSPLRWLPAAVNSEAYLTVSTPFPEPGQEAALTPAPAPAPSASPGALELAIVEPLNPKLARYDAAQEEILAVLEGEADLTARMATVASMLADAFPVFLWTGFYVVDRRKPDELVVGPYQGKLGCLRIPFGRGVCGTAAAQRRTQVVPDVHAFAGHIPCDSRANSEIVVPVHDASGNLIAVLDVDSADYSAFDQQDAAALERLMARVFAV